MYISPDIKIADESVSCDFSRRSPLDMKLATHQSGTQALDVAKYAPRRKLTVTSEDVLPEPFSDKGILP